MEAINAVFGGDQERRSPMFLTTAKSYVGHCEYASGLVAIMKACLMLQNNTVPKHLHVDELRGDLNFNQVPLKVPYQSSHKWDEESVKTVCVNNFGLAGSICCAVLQTAPKQSNSRKAERFGHYLIPFSAKTEKALNTYWKKTVDALSRHQLDTVDMADIAYMASVCRDHFAHRSYVLAESMDDLMQQLNHRITAKPNLENRMKEKEQPEISIAFICGGSSISDDVRPVIKELSNTFPVFADSVRHCLTEAGTVGLQLDLDSKEESIQTKQLIYFILQVSLAKLWKSWMPEQTELRATLGESLGEITAAYLAGRLQLKDAFEIIRFCCSALEAAQSSSAYLVSVISSDFETVNSLLRQIKSFDLHIGEVRTPKNCVVYGTESSLASLIKLCTQKGISCSPIGPAPPCHTSLLRPFFKNVSKNLISETTAHGNSRSCTFWSSMFARPIDIVYSDYWFNFLVNMNDSLQTLEAFAKMREADILIDLGISGNITGSIAGIMRKINTQTPITVIQSVHSGNKLVTQPLFHGIGQLYTMGIDVLWENIYENPPTGPKNYAFSLPTYPFQRNVYKPPGFEEYLGLSMSDSSEERTLQSAETDRLKGHNNSSLPAQLISSPSSQSNQSNNARQATALPPIDAGFKSSNKTDQELGDSKVLLTEELLEALKDHKMDGKTVFPAAAFVLIASQLLGEEKQIDNIRFLDRFYVEAEEVGFLVLSVEFKGFQFTLSMEKKAGSKIPVATGRYGLKKQPTKVPMTIDINSFSSNLEPIEVERFYKNFYGLQYGESYRIVDRLWGNSFRVASVVRPRLWHPIPILDACIHSIRGFIVEDQDLHLPVAAANISVHQKLQDCKSVVYCNLVLLSRANENSFVQVSIYDSLGRIIMHFDQFVLHRFGRPQHLSLPLYEVKTKLDLSKPDQQFREVLFLSDSDSKLISSSQAKLQNEGVTVQKRSRLPQNLVNAQIVDFRFIEEERSFGRQNYQECFQTLQQVFADVGRYQRVQLILIIDQHDAVLSSILRSFAGVGQNECKKSVTIQSVQIQNLNGFVEGVVHAIKQRPLAVPNLIQDEKYNYQVPSLVPFTLMTSTANKETPTTWLVAGGSGGVGAHLVRYLIEKKFADRVILFGRSTNIKLGDDWTDLLSKIMYFSLDLTENHFEKISNILSTYSVEGIVHASGILNDRLIQRQDWESFRSVFSVKWLGGLALHQATLNHPVKHFIALSSISSVLFTPGQLNYVAGNQALESIVLERNATGRPGTVLQLGPVSGTGKPALLKV